MSVLDRALVRTLPLLPRGAARTVASPCIAGETIADACPTRAQSLDTHASVKPTGLDLKLEKDAYEFQMLLGVREHLTDALVHEGRGVRTHVPFGKRWYEYSLRRLQENPRIAAYVAADTVRRAAVGGPRR